MPTLLTRTFALLNNIKPPTTTTNTNTESAPIAHPNNVLLLSPNKTNNDQIKLTSTVFGPAPATIEQKYTSTPDISIWKAAEKGDLAALQYYIHHHTSSVDPITFLNTRDPDTDCTLLHLVVSNNSNNQAVLLPLLQLLLEHGADATARNVYNVQAIHMVSLHCPNPLQSIELLLNHKASPNARDGDGWTPLHYAARFCRPPDKVLQLLISRGADVNLTDSGHKSPLFGLLANGDLTTALDWMIHTAKADVSIRGDFLDQASRKTRPGTIVLQAAKYGRLDCLSLLIKSTVAMNQLRRVMHRDELSHANFIVKDQQARLRRIDGSEQQLAKLDLILDLLQELEDTLERDPLSLLNSRKLNTASTSPPTVEQEVLRVGNNKIQRRHSSFMSTMMDSMRKKRAQQAAQANNKPATPSGLFRKMSRIIKRSKSENNAASSGLAAVKSKQSINDHNRYNGPSR
jgi:hypothetical protein